MDPALHYKKSVSRSKLAEKYFQASFRTRSKRITVSFGFCLNTNFCCKKKNRLVQ